MRSESPAIGTVFGKWTVVAALALRSGHTMVRVRCHCGVEVDRRVVHLTSGASTRCKHRSYESRQKSKTPEYEAWLALIQRCTNPKNPRWKDYGGRGITVCDAWRE